MPRNASGTYTLTAGNPVVADTLIESNWANPTLADIAQALTDSLDRYGRGSMVASVKFPDGTMAAPSIAFAAESSTGFYRPAAKVLAATVSNSEILRLEPTKVTLKSAGANMLLVEPTKMTVTPPTTFTGAPSWITAPTVNEHLTNKAYVDSYVATYVNNKLTTGAPGGGYLALSGGALTGNISINAGVTDSTIELINTTAPAGKQKGHFKVEDSGDVIFGGYSGSAWDRGIEVRANGQLYDLAGAAFVMNTNGGTFTNTVTINRGAGASFADLMVTVDGAPTTAHSATVRHQSNGNTYFGQWDTAKAVLNGGICVDAANLLWDVKSGQKIWHGGNDGPNSGLDADLLDSYHGAFANQPNTYALRDINGVIYSSAISSNNTPRVWVNFDGKVPALRNWYNVSSLTDRGTARTSINFSTALLNKDYCAIATVGDNFYTSYDWMQTAQIRYDMRTTTKCDVYCYRSTGSSGLPGGDVDPYEPTEVNFLALHYGS